MGLVVDEIVDIVEDYLDIEVPSDISGILGSAVIKEKATEVIDIGHYLPLAFEDWFLRKEMERSSLSKNLLFVDDSSFFRNMLGPVLKAAGYDVTVCSSAKDALNYLEDGRDFDEIVSDIEMPDMNGFEFAEVLKKDKTLQKTPIVAPVLPVFTGLHRARASGRDLTTTWPNSIVPVSLRRSRKSTNQDMGVAA